MLFHKKTKYEMDAKSADDVLQHILSACDQAPNPTFYDQLLLKQKANHRFYNRLLILTILVIILTFLLPLLVIFFSASGKSLATPKPAALVTDYVEDGMLCLKLSGDNIQYHAAYMETLDGTVIPPVSYDRGEQLICFPYPDDQEVNIYIPIKNGVPLHLLFTPASK